MSHGVIESGPLLSTSDILPWVCTQALLLSGETGIKGSSSHSLQGEREAGTEELAIVHTHTDARHSFFPQPQPATVITGGLTAAAGASAKTGPCATPSRGLATVLRASGAGAVRSAASRAPTVTTVTRDASARTERPAIMSRGNAAAHLDTLEPCK